MKVKFVPQDVEYEIEQGQTLMDLAHKKGIPIRSTCNGLPQCAECRVRVIEGDSNVNPPSRKELNLIGTGYYIDQRRLSCQVLCFGDIVVDTAEQLDKAGEGPITKKYLSRIHKDSAEDTHSVGGVLIEQDGALLKQIESSVTVESNQPREQHRDRGHRPPQPSQQQASPDGLVDVMASRPQQQGGQRDGGGNRGGRNRNRNRNRGRR